MSQFKLDLVEFLGWTEHLAHGLQLEDVKLEATYEQGGGCPTCYPEESCLDTTVSAVCSGCLGDPFFPHVPGKLYRSMDGQDLANFLSSLK